MRISDDRYSRDRQRLDVALRFIEHEARTHTIRQWTGLTDDRIRKLYRSYLCDHSGNRIHRHRGKSPHQPAHFLRTVRMRQEAAVLASIFCLTGLLPARVSGAAAARLAPGIRRGQLLCQAFEVYRAVAGTPQISFEHALYLLLALSRCDELAVGNCHACNALVVVDRLSLREPRCNACSAGPSPRPGEP